MPAHTQPRHSAERAGSRRSGARAWKLPPGYAGVVSGLIIVFLGIDHGGTGRGAWLVAAAAFAAAGAAVIAGRARPSGASLAWLAVLTALTGWTALSSLWAAAPSVALLEANRTLVYLAAAAVIALAASADLRWVPHSVMIATSVVCLDAIALRAFPSFPGNSPLLGYGRLYQPLGYWNALGILAAMGGLVALQIAASNERRAWRIAASLSLPVTVPVMYLTFSRGALIAFAAGLVVSALVAGSRIDWTVCAVANLAPPALVIAIAAHQPGLVSGDTAAGGGPLAAAVVLGLAAAVAVAMALDARPAALRSARLSRRTTVVVGVSLVAVAAVGLVAAVGSPITAGQRASAEFKREIWFQRDLRGNLNNRYLELSLSGRVGVWDGALRLAGDHPVAGAGAGSFGAYWKAQNTYPKLTREALSLYLETLAELGAVGLVLLAGVFLFPLWRAVGAPSDVRFVLGALVAFCLHAAQDMDWEWPAVTVIGIICAALVVRQTEARAPVPALVPALRLGLAGACLAGAAVSLTATAFATGVL
jgi:O-antigen ligase